MRSLYIFSVLLRLSGSALVAVISIPTDTFSAGNEPIQIVDVDKKKGPLANLPSPPGTHIEKIRNLPNDSWLNLGVPQGDPKWGRARGRAWGGRALISAADLRGAFFYGEGVHAFVKPDGHMMDDMWFYDINANRWIAIYPGTDTITFSEQVKSGDLRLNDDGQLVNKLGQLIPVHLLIHAWNYLAYDSHSKKFAILADRGFGRYFIGNEPKMNEGLKILEAQLAGRPSLHMSPWFYNTISGEFERYRIKTPLPDVGSIPNLQYVKGRKQFFYGSANGVAYFDDAARKWTQVKDSGPRAIGYDHGGTYDDKRERIYMGPGEEDPTGALRAYDPKTETWTKLSNIGAPTRQFSTGRASTMYDAKNDVVTVFQYAEKKIYIYAPATDTWTNHELPAHILASPDYASFSAFYDAELNAYFLYAATDSADNGVMWAYRYKK